MTRPRNPKMANPHFGPNTVFFFVKEVLIQSTHTSNMQCFHCKAAPNSSACCQLYTTAQLCPSSLSVQLISPKVLARPDQFLNCPHHWSQLECERLFVQLVCKYIFLFSHHAKLFVTTYCQQQLLAHHDKTVLP